MSNTILKILARACVADAWSDEEARSRTKQFARVLSRILAGESVYDAFGSPGDWGYDTDVGAAFAALCDKSWPKPKTTKLLDEADHRAALVRMVVAEQWGVAISFWWDEARGNGLDSDPEGDRWSAVEYAEVAEQASRNMAKTNIVRHFARMSCAVDVVVERLGGAR